MCVLFVVYNMELCWAPYSLPSFPLPPNGCVTAEMRALFVVYNMELKNL